SMKTGITGKMGRFAIVCWAMSGCLATPGAANTATMQPVPTCKIEDQMMKELVPLPESFLDQIYRMNGGLLTGLDDHGVPKTDGPDADPAIQDTRSFYDTLGTPQRPPNDTAPKSFDAWKETFGFPARGLNEDLEIYRARAGIVVYYNRDELGL